MKIKNNGLENYPRSPYIPKVEPNLFFANKKVKTSYKEYEVLIDNNIGLGKFKKNVAVIPEDIINLIKEYDDMARDFRTKKSLDETTKTLWHNILFFSGCECFVTTYNEQGLVTSYEVDDFVFVFKYNEQQQLTEWTATISDQIPCIYSFLYNEKGLLYKITEKIPTGIFKEYLYDEKGDMVAVVEDGYIDEYQYSYNSKGELVRLKHYLNEKVQNEDLLLYDERGNKTLFCSFREENEEDEDEDRRKVFINSYKNGHLAKQEILYYENGNKEFLFFDEQGNIIEKQYFEIKPYQGFELLYTVFYKYFDGKVERTQINEDFKEVIVCKDIVHEEDPLCNKRRYDRHRYNLFIDKLFSYALYDKNSDEMERFVRTYLTNGEMGTVFYRNGTPEYIVRKECTIVEN
ncbi:hypothetical protein [Capnocytophaga sputigena]|jgi:hypothetical protein|uniref:Sugar-binding protein n=1 Tax=Capnocytophaga sputigena TaxID=1019 RepID=A0AAX2ID38_CAPSP|nr:hypothetical protein [Capnocytophaga sputigena]ATA84132.1 hypothetical protein CGC55_06250 [Capnocytophaga sputigena]EEB64449.1 hypothetical protein CAPSP0001_0993 [Capnocytophaga sputigena ATCC 33612]SQA74894.1 Uncharacterised protein [Capnocytophaga sputigena]